MRCCARSCSRGHAHARPDADPLRRQHEADNAAELLAQPDIDGGLIGGASLKAADFLQIICRAAR